MSRVTHSMSIRSCDTSWPTPVRITTGISVPSSICSARLASPTVFRCMASGTRDRRWRSAFTSDPIERTTPPQLQETEERLIERIGQEAWDRLGRYDDACEAGDPGQPSHYLGMLGIVSSHQRQGFGKALVAATKELARCSADSRGILLNTETEKNIPYYGKLGFRVVGEADADHVHTWSMFWSCE